MCFVQGKTAGDGRRVLELLLERIKAGKPVVLEDLRFYVVESRFQLQHAVSLLEEAEEKEKMK